MERRLIGEMYPAAFVLRPIKGKVGIAHQCFDGCPIARTDRRADAGTDVQRMMIDLIRFRETVDHTLRNILNPVEIGGIADNDCEFIAAEPSAHFVLGDLILQPLRHPGKQLVADGMAQRIVDRLEAVEVDHQEGAASPPLLGVAQCFSQPFGQHHPVRQTGQRIVAGKISDFFGAFALFGDIRSDPAKTVERTVIIEFGRARKFPPALRRIDRDANQQIGKAFAALKAFGKVVQARGKRVEIPRFAGDQLDKGLAIDRRRIPPHGKGEPGRNRPYPARRIGLPQPVRFALLEFA